MQIINPEFEHTTDSPYLALMGHWAVLLKYGCPVAKRNPCIHGATQGPTVDGPFGDQYNHDLEP